MKKVLHKSLALLLSACMLLSMLTVASAANESETDGSTSSGFSWEAVEDSDATASIVSDETAEAEEEDEIDPSTEVRVAIVFEEDSALAAGYSTTDIAENDAALAYMDELAESQEAVLETIADEVYDGEALETGYSFTLTTNAVTATIAYGDIAAIEAVEGVSAVYVQTQYEMMDDTQTTTAAEMISSTSAWAAGYTGAGMKVAIVDTGIDIDHPSFSQQGYLYSLEQSGDDSYTESWLTADQVAEILPYLNASATYYAATGKTLSVGDVYQNAKVPFAYNYVDENLDITHDNDSQGDHGTHVSGIAAANTYIYVDGEYVEAADEQDVYTVGVAPDAQILTMKVFGTAGGAWSEDYVAAIEDAILLGADAVNLSLGSAAAGMVLCDDEWEQGIFDSLSDSDTIVSISAGNNSYWSEYSNYGLNLTDDTSMATTSSPSTYTNALSVASADNTGSTGYSFNAADVTVVYTETTGYGNEAFTTLDTSADGSGTEYEFVMLDVGVYGNEEDFAGIDVEGKIVFVQRGSISFYVKADNAAELGALGAVIYNNTSGSISMDLTGYSHTIPAVSILESEGLEIMENAEAHTTESGVTYYTGTITVYSNMSRVYAAAGEETSTTMSSFSSWGAPSDLSISPEITAPGGSIWSTYTDGEYGVMSGTSMAAPSVTGMSALVLQYVYDNEALSALVDSGTYTARALAQSLLMGTANPLMDADSGVEYSVRQQGSGLANVYAAVTSPTFITVEGQEDGKVKAELGDDADRTGVYSFTFDVTNYSDETVYYDLDSSVLTADVIVDYGYTFMSTSDTELGSTTAFALGSSGLANDLNGDGSVDTLDALLVLQYANDKDTLTEDQLDLADQFTGDGEITTRDAYLWLVAVSDTDSDFVNLASFSLEDGTLTVTAGATATVTVTISLTEGGMDWLDENYSNGGYVEGYVYLNASSGGNEEGAITAVDQSIPFLAYYGSWAEPSMYEINEFIELWYAEEYDYNYAASLYTNYFTLTTGGDSYYFLSNLYADDNEYISDRNALNNENGDAIGSAVFTQIRNSADTYIQVVDAETGEVYYSQDLGAYYAEYYYSSDSSWYYTSNTATINWAGTDADGNPLAEDTKVIVQVVAVTEYTDEDGNYIIGDGSTLDLPLTIDNTAPVGDGALNEDGELVITVSDNNYVAAVQLLDADDNLLASISPNQTEAGVESEVNLGDLSEYTAYQGTSIYTVIVVDYAGNETEYRVKLDDSEEYATEATSVVLSTDSLAVLRGNSATLTAKVYPLNAEDRTVTWSSADESIATVNASGMVTGVSEGTTTIRATSNLTPTVYAECEVEVFTIDIDLNALYWDEDGYVHEVGINTQDLSTYDEIMSFGTTQYMSQAQADDGTLYVATYTSSVLGSQCSDIYTLDLETGETEYVGSSYWMTDMVYSPALGDAGCLVGTYGPYIVYFDLATGAYDVSYSFSEYVTGISLIGTYYYGNGYYYDYYYVVSQSGNVYEFGLIDMGGSRYYFSPYNIGSTGISTAWYFNSLYYYYDEDTGDEYLFYSGWDGNNNAYLYATTFDADYYVDTTVTVGGYNTGVWPVSGLCELDTTGSSTASSRAGDIASSTPIPATQETVVPLDGVTDISK